MTRIETHFLPAGRLSPGEIARQQEQVVQCPVLISMLDTTPQMLAVINPERQIVFCNDACVTAAGMASKEEVLGKRPGELLKCVHASSMPGGCGASMSCRFCGLAQALLEARKGKPVTGECQLECDGPSRSLPREFEVRVTPLPDLGEAWQCYALTDISHEKRRQALERTFFHDILNRAAAVDGVSSLLVSREVSEEEQQGLFEMLSVSSVALVEEILAQRTLLAAEQGDLAVSLTPRDSRRSLLDAVASCQAIGLIGRKQLIGTPEPDQVQLVTDHALLGRVLLNLLKNALEASSPEQPVTTTVSRTPAGVRFSVHNHKEMPANVRAQVFRRSFSTKGAGRGLGTYSARLIAEGYLNGQVWFESSPAAGTTFHVELPLRPSA